MKHKDNTQYGPAPMGRRSFFKTIGAGSLALAAASCGRNPRAAASEAAAGEGNMEYRFTPTSGDKVSLLGYGCMRFPMKNIEGSRRREVDQETVNRLVDYAIEHGVNYFDTSPGYLQGQSERATGIALKRHPRDKFFIATKLSNFAPATQTREGAMEMYHNSFKELQVDYIDYYLLHSVGGGGLANLRQRYLDNGMLDFLLEERKAGRIRHLGFSFHGDIEVYDYLLSMHDVYKWDFVQIQMNYIDWNRPKDVKSRNSNASYLYEELAKRGIAVVIMEPLLGGRLATLPNHMTSQLQALRPERSVASWAFRFAGTYPKVLTVLSGMTYMEHLQDNVSTYAPFEPCTEAELALLERMAKTYMSFPLISCTECNYCMPCPYGLDIPGIFVHYNRCVNEGHVVAGKDDDQYKKARRAFLVGYDRSVPKLRQADHCIGCNRCTPHCPQQIRIPQQMERISRYVEDLKQDRLGE